MSSPNGSDEPREPETVMWSDNEATIDLLRFDYLADEVAAVVSTAQLLPVTVGIYGNWGGGKSTLIRMVLDRLTKQPAVMTLQFNGWLFEGYEDAKTALMGSILDAIEDRVRDDKSFPERGGELLQRLKQRVNWLQLASLAGRYVAPIVAGLPQLTLANLGADTVKLVQSAAAEKVSLEDAQKLIASAPEGPENVRRNIRDFRRDFAKLLTESKIETLVVFIDDLDRCLPDTIIETLEAIKLFLFVSKTAFVIGADERLVQYAVRQRFPELPGTETEVGRDYLEKLIQVPIRVPPLTKADIESYLNLLFAERRLETDDYSKACASLADFRADNVAESAFDLTRAQAILGEQNITTQLQDDFDFTAQIVPVLAPGLDGNPRRAKRFLNTLLLRLSLGARRGLRLERRILAKLMLLEYIREEFFRTLASLQAEESGQPGALAMAERMLRARTEPAIAESDDSPDTSQPGPVAARGSRTSRRGASTQDADDKVLALPEDALPTEIQPWLADPWTRAWLASEPSLGGTDLGPYFFIAHDRIGARTDTGLRLSPAATDVLTRLLSPGGATRELGLRHAASLSVPDAVAVFQNLAQRIRQAEALDARSPHTVLLKLMGVRPELLPQLVSLYGSFPESKITVATPPQIVSVTRDTSSAAAARSLLDRWKRSRRTALARAAEAALQRA